MATLEQKAHSADEFWEFVSRLENADKRLELHEGTILELTPSSAIPGIVAARITGPLSSFVYDRKLGYVATAEAGFVLSPQTVLAPDVAYISKARQPTLPERFFTAAPDLAVEVVSPTDSIKAVHRKALRYIKYGVHLVWIVYPEDRTVEVYSPSEYGDAVIKELGIDDVLSGGDVLPGFELALRDVFSVLE
jgi:Uma2 family endonuclease